jgi:hypothetical protein
MVFHGLENSRFKDFYDVYLLSSRFVFRGDRIAAAIMATFTRHRALTFETWPVALTNRFYEDAARTEQWR